MEALVKSNVRFVMRQLGVSQLKITKHPFPTIALPDPDSLFNLFILTPDGSRPPPACIVPENGKADDKEHKRYSVFFAQDAIISVLFGLATESIREKTVEAAKATVFECIRWQATEDEPKEAMEGVWSNARKGGIPHEVRNPDDQTAKMLKEKWKMGMPFYGTLMPTLLFIKLVNEINAQDSHFLEQTVKDKDGKDKSVREAVADAASWIQEKIRVSERNPLGLIASESPNRLGPQYQSWTDSWYTKTDENGKLIRPPLYMIEVQALASKALENAATLLESAHEQRKTLVYRADAERLKKEIIDHYRIQRPDGSYYFASDLYFGTDGELKPRTALTPDAGWLLWSKLFNDNERGFVHEIVSQIFSPSLVSKWGIRTLAEDDIAYFAPSYHRGSIWQFFNGILADGLMNYGFNSLWLQLHGRNLKIHQLTSLFSEYISGEDSIIPEINDRSVKVMDADGIERELLSVSQPYQAWTYFSYLRARVIFDKIMKENASSQVITGGSDLEMTILSSLHVTGKMLISNGSSMEFA